MIDCHTGVWFNSFIGAITDLDKEATAQAMVVGNAVSNLKKELEQLFPGKWLTGGETTRSLKTGLDQIDGLLVAGLHKRRVTEWQGAASSGKTSVLRTVCANWCAAGYNVIYIDTFDRLQAIDWCYLNGKKNGERFWVLRGNSHIKESIWACEQLIRSRVFDAIVFDMCEKSISSNLYARLQQALDKSNTALIVLRDQALAHVDDGDMASTRSGAQNWGAHLKIDFSYCQPIRTELGLSGHHDDVVTVMPTIQGTISKDGLSKSLEVSSVSYVTNRLFTHSQIPDRRTPQVRARAQA